MTAMTQQPTLAGRPRSGTLYDVLELILDKGLVIDVYLRVSLVGIELVTVDARIVVASVDTYLHFAEAVNRLDLTQSKDSKTLDEFIGGLQEKGAHGKTKGAVSGVTSAIGDAAQRFTHRDDDEEGSDDGHQPRRRAAAAPRRRRPPEDREG
jgi:hypothetical protein